MMASPVGVDSHRNSVALRRRMFEQLSAEDGPRVPDKPKRTFVHDQYMALKSSHRRGSAVAKTSASSFHDDGPKLVICNPIPVSVGDKASSRALRPMSSKPASIARPHFSPPAPPPPPRPGKPTRRSPNATGISKSLRDDGDRHREISESDFPSLDNTNINKISTPGSYYASAAVKSSIKNQNVGIPSATKNVIRPSGRVISHEYEHIAQTNGGIHDSDVDSETSTVRRTYSDELIYAKSDLLAGYLDENGGGRSRATSADIPNSQPANSLYYESTPIVSNVNATSSNGAFEKKRPTKKFIDRLTATLRSPGSSRFRRRRDTQMLDRARAFKILTTTTQSGESSHRNSEFNDDDEQAGDKICDYAQSSDSRMLTPSNASRCVIGRPGVAYGNPTAHSGCSDLSESESTSEIQELSQRATVLRTKTILYHETELAFRRRRSPQLFNLFALVRLKPVGEFNGPLPVVTTAARLPYIHYSYPHASGGRHPHMSASNESGDLGMLPFLCFPDFPYTDLIQRSSSDQYFVITLTDELGSRKFAYCCRYVNQSRSSFAQEIPDKAVILVPEVVVLLSPINAVTFYNKILCEIVHKTRIQFNLAKDFVHSIFRQPFPSPGRPLVLNTNIVGKILLNHDSESENVAHNASLLLSKLGSENLVLLCESLLCEKRCLIIGNNVPELSRCVQAAVSLLAPFQWPHTLIPVIPDCSVHICCAPTPYIIGTMRFNLDKIKDVLVQDEEQFLFIVDVDMGVIKNSNFESMESRENNLNPATSLKSPGLPRRIHRGIHDALDSLLEDAARDAEMDAEMDLKMSDLFQLMFVELVGHHRLHIARQQDGSMVFQKKKFVESHKSKSVRKFLSWFVETGMFQIWSRQRLKNYSDLGTLDDFFEAKVDQALRRKPSSGRWMKPSVSLSSWLSFSK